MMMIVKMTDYANSFCTDSICLEGCGSMVIVDLLVKNIDMFHSAH